MLKKFFTYAVALFAVFAVFTSCADDNGGDAPFVPERDYDLNPTLRPDPLHKHALADQNNDLLNLWFYQYVFEYTSVGPDLKTPVRLTGVISMNPAVFNREVKPTHVMLYNEFTTSKHGERTSQDEIDDIGLYLNKFNNCIAISADLYGWTLTEDKPQAYSCSNITAQETVDCWDAAMQILKQLKFDVKGLPIYNVGYSSGALGAMAVQKYVDANRPDIEFTGTFVGGGNYDLEAIYNDYIETDTTGYVCALPLMLVAYKETYNIPCNYSDIFREPLASHIDEWILSKDYGTWDINGLIGPEKHVSEILTPEACNPNSPLVQPFIEKFRENSVCGPSQNWQPSTKTQFFVYHSTGDLYITFKVGLDMANYLKDKGCNVSVTLVDHGNHVQYGLLYFTLDTQLRMTGREFELPDGMTFDDLKALILNK
ncbi:MAG: hypothetical protein HUK02_04170 [Bacteroidaceae bacterium]|nr:hypothetical protein [Bacteroidaceae bacterium]